MPLNPVAPVTDYQSMLNRIFWFTTASALAAIWVLRLHVPALNAYLGRIDIAVAVGDGHALPTPAGSLIPALAVGIATRIFRLHSRVSDWLCIRECFDLEAIIGESADRLNIDLSPIGDDRLRRSRHDLMRRTFYAYVSTSQPQIDRQLIEQALDAWSWFWVGVEATIIFTLTGFGLIASSAYQVGFETLGAALAVAALGLPAVRGQCKRYAVAQVRAILADATRAGAVRKAFAELTEERPIQRMAA